jgi:hypothetical protein
MPMGGMGGGPMMPPGMAPPMPGANPMGGGGMKPGTFPAGGGPSGGKSKGGAPPGGSAPAFPMGGSLGPPAGVGPGGGGPGGPPPARPLLSWRVEILPQLGEADLYWQFKLDEPWDGPHNKKLIAKMPKAYAPPGVKTKQPGLTYYQAFVGPHAAFEKNLALTLPAGFPDGTSNTLLIAEAARPVPWTKPEDLDVVISADKLPPLGGLFPGRFNAALADGSVYQFSTRGDPNQLRRAILRDDGYAVDLGSLRVPVSRKEYEMRRQNQLIKKAIAAEKTRLEELRREKQVLDEMVEDAETRRLRAENEQLQKALRDLRDQADHLRVELERMKRPAERR